MEHGRTCGIWIDVLVYCMQPHGGAVGWQCMRYIPVGDGIQQHGGQGGIWLLLCVYQYTDCMATGQHGIPMQQGVYLCTIYEHSIQPPSPGLRNARVRVSRARACVRACILLYYYNIIKFN